MLDYGLQAAGALTIGLGLLPVVAALATLARPKGERADARARAFTSLFVAARGRLRRLHGGQGRVPVHGRRHARRGAEPDLPRPAPVRRDGAVDRPAARALDPAGRGGRVRRLPDRGDAVPARQPCPPRDSPGVAIVADGEQEPVVRARRNRARADRRAGDRGRPARGAALPRGGGGRERRGRGRLPLLVLAWSLTGQISAANYSNNESQALVGELPAPARLARRAHARQADALPRPEPELGHRPRSVADRVLEPLAQVRLVGRRLGARPRADADAEHDTRTGGSTPPSAGVDYVLAENGHRARRHASSGKPPRDGPLGPLQGEEADPLRVQPDRGLRRRPDGLRPGTVPGGERARTTASRRRAQRPGYAVVDVSRVIGVRGAGPAGGGPRDDRDARRGRRQAAAHRTRDRTSSAGRCGSGRRAVSSCLRRRRPSASRCGSRRRTRRSRSAAPTSACSAARSASASRSGRWSRA